MRWGSPTPLVGEAAHKLGSGRPRSRGRKALIGTIRSCREQEGGREGSRQAHEGPREGRAGGRERAGCPPTRPAGKGVQKGSPPPSSADLSQRFLSYSLSLGQLDSAQRSGSSPSQPSHPRTPAGRCHEPQLLLPAWPAGPRFSLGWRVGPGSPACGSCTGLVRKARS